MKLLAGLGNPGPRYSSTRHNVGFMLVDRLAAELGVKVTRAAFRGLTAEGSLDGEKILLLKPQIYMNLSGDSVAEAMRYYRIDPGDILVAYDDLDLDLGRLRFRPSGSAGGHRGAQSIIDLLGTDKFPRLRMGIGRPQAGFEVIDYVLSTFGPSEVPALNGMLERASQGVRAALGDGIEAAMSRFNAN